MGMLEQVFGGGCPFSHQPPRIKEKTLESGNPRENSISVLFFQHECKLITVIGRATKCKKKNENKYYICIMSSNHLKKKVTVKISPAVLAAPSSNSVKSWKKNI